MAKEKNKNTTKSFVMVMVTGVVLVAVTLCWFAIANRSSVDSVDSNVENSASSKANISVGIDSNDRIAIKAPSEGDERALVKYTPVESESTIVLSNMIPGAEYFYKAEFIDCKVGQTISLTFEGITGELAEKLTVYRKITTSNDTTIHPNGENDKLLGLLNNVELKKTLEEADISVSDDYTVYFSFKFADDATVEPYADKSVIIENVNINLSSEA